MAAADWPVDMPAHWMIYFAVQDCDQAAAHARTLGGRILQPPTNLQIGRYAVLEDPQGGMFAVLSSRG
jgi:hypothetical protein